MGLVGGRVGELGNEGRETTKNNVRSRGTDGVPKEPRNHWETIRSRQNHLSGEDSQL